MSFFNAIFTFLYEILFGCRHEKLTRPFTLEHETYKVCLDCGRHVFYSTETMRPLRGSEVRRMKLGQSGDQRDGDQRNGNNFVPLAGRFGTEVSRRSSSSVAA